MLLVTGAGGFIGSVFLWKLNNEGIKDIIVVDNFGTKDKWKNLRNKNFIEYINKKNLFEYLQENSNVLKEISAIIHLGACSDTTEKDMDYLYDNNVNFTLKLLKICFKNNIRFIYASSAAVYGNGQLGFNDDNVVVENLKPLNKYGFSKWLVDNYVINYNLDEKVCGLRFFNVFGPNEYHKGHMSSVVYKAFNQIKESGKVKLFKSTTDDIKHGEQKRDFIYVKDVVDIIFYFLKSKNKNGIFNVGTGQANTFNKLVENIFKNMNINQNVEYISMPENIKKQYQNFTEADINKLRSKGYDKPFTPFDIAIKDYLSNYLITGNMYI